jgi:hypothetical protein
MEPDIVAEHQQRAEVVERPRRRARVVTAADIQDETAVIGEHTEDFARERAQPLDVIVLVRVAVLLLEVEGVWWRRHDEVDRAVRKTTQELLRVAEVHGPSGCRVGRLCPKEFARVGTLRRERQRQLDGRTPTRPLRSDQILGVHGRHGQTSYTLAQDRRSV